MEEIPTNILIDIEQLNTKPTTELTNESTIPDVKKKRKRTKTVNDEATPENNDEYEK